MVRFFRIFLVFIFRDCGKRKGRKRKRGRKNQPPPSPRNTAKLCIKSKERNLRRLLLLSRRRLYFSSVFFNFLHLCAHGHRGTRQSLILSYDYMIIYPAFFSSRARSFIQGFSQPDFSFILNSTISEKTLRQRIYIVTLCMSFSVRCVSKATRYKDVQHFTTFYGFTWALVREITIFVNFSSK